MAKPTHYVHCNIGNALFVKEASFFEEQGGLTERWGKAWKPVVATSIAHARRKASEIFGVPLSPIHDEEQAEDLAKRERLDALGNQLIDTADYYIQDARGYVGDFFSWWKPNGAGYTCDVDQAGVYKGADMRIGKRETDLAWPVAAVQVGIVRVVDSERVVRTALRKEARRG